MEVTPPRRRPSDLRRNSSIDVLKGLMVQSIIGNPLDSGGARGVRGVRGSRDVQDNVLVTDTPGKPFRSAMNTPLRGRRESGEAPVVASKPSHLGHHQVR